VSAFGGGILIGFCEQARKGMHQRVGTVRGSAARDSGLGFFVIAMFVSGFVGAAIVQEVMVMSAPFMVSQTAGLVLAVILGFFFGLFLERGGLGNPTSLTGVFYLTDFSVPKVYVYRMLVAATGLYLLSDLKILDMNRVWIVPTFFWPQLVGGALFWHRIPVQR